jgi:hypothetical protein
MAIFFFLSFLALLASAAYMAWTWQRHRRHLAQLLARLVPLTKTSGNRSRMLHIRHLGFDVFLNDQLLKEMEREVTLLERERDIETTNPAERPIFSSKKRLNHLEKRIANLELDAEE